MVSDALQFRNDEQKWNIRLKGLTFFQGEENWIFQLYVTLML